MTVTYEQYANDKQAFFKKHSKSDWKVTTSAISGYQYSKQYVFDDGAQWEEIMDLVVETAEVEVKGCKCKVKVMLQCTEYWNTDDSASKFMYQPW